jgi:hypothetical protein
LINGSSSSILGHGYHGGSYRDRYGRLDLNTAINYELRKQELLEDRKKLGDALKSLIKDASPSADCKTENASYYSTSKYCPPGYTPVVIDPGSTPHWVYLDVD